MSACTLYEELAGDSRRPDPPGGEQAWRERLEAVLDTLSPREARVIRERYLRDRRMTFGELSDIFRVSEKRTWQIGQKALRKLRHPSRSRFLLGRAGLTAPMWSPVRTARPHTVIPPPRVLRPDLPLRDRLFLEVRDLELSVRLANCLDAAEVRFIGDLVQKSEAELLRTKNFGRKSLREVSELLAVLDL